jgi:hypothetical protein
MKMNVNKFDSKVVTNISEESAGYIDFIEPFASVKSRKISIFSYYTKQD